MAKVHVQRSTTKEFARRHRGTFFSSCVAMCNDHSPLRRRLRHNRHASRRGPPRDIRFLSVRRWRRRGMAEAGTGVPKVAIHRICVATSPRLANCPHISQTYSMKDRLPALTVGVGFPDSFLGGSAPRDIAESTFVCPSPRPRTRRIFYPRRWPFACLR